MESHIGECVSFLESTCVIGRGRGEVSPSPEGRRVLRVLFFDFVFAPQPPVSQSACRIINLYRNTGPCVPTPAFSTLVLRRLTRVAQVVVYRESRHVASSAAQPAGIFFPASAAHPHFPYLPTGAGN